MEDQTNIVASTHALLIGVNDYQSYDGTTFHDLRGSLNDVVLLAWYCQEKLGVPPENIRVLTTPPLSAEQISRDDALAALRSLPASQLGEATEANVRDGIAWLLAATKGEGQAALFSFSGHGAWTSDKGPVLCLGGVRSGLQEGVLALRELGSMVKEAEAQSRVVALLDCCHVVGTAREGHKVSALPHEGTAEDVARSAQDFAVSDRVLLGAKPGKNAYQIRLGLHRRGALTFSLVTAAERWHASDGMSHGSYKHVIKRARQVLRGVGVPQTVKMLAPAERWKELRKQPFLAVVPGKTTPKPDARGRSAQIDPNFYTITIWPNTDRETILAQVVATASPEQSCEVKVQSVGIRADVGKRYPGTECWYINQDAVAKLGVTLTASITPTALTSAITLDSSVKGQANNSLPYFTSPESATWGDSAYESAASNVIHLFVKSNDSTVVLQLDVASWQNDEGNTVQSLVGVQWWSNAATTSVSIQPPKGAYSSTTQNSSDWGEGPWRTARSL